MSDQPSLPGDAIASIEEYESGANTFDDGDKVRSAVVGIPTIDKKLRIASVGSTKSVPVPEKGDIIVGTVAAVMNTMMAVTIRRINGRAINSGVECICSTKNMRMKTVALVGDAMVLKIIGRLNGATHAAMNEPELGVLFTKCRKCGMGVIPVRNGVKCTECGWIDDRKMSSDFGNKQALCPT